MRGGCIRRLLHPAGKANILGDFSRNLGSDILAHFPKSPVYTTHDFAAMYS